ncbi:S41 family peptidase [Aquisphaera insulae]|uniref:S41 family peptidase n=1 Tax=Aquisphaera insulae TaxID=2712864 RepID=UPI0013EBCF48|nr:S41 family peptidase [Aquisphaera insulae]
MRIAGLAALLASILLPARAESGTTGYYRQPTVARGSIAFVAEGDLWTVPLAGGPARRLTTHPAAESRPAFSPDGKTLAFVGRYEGPAEVYTIPADGGLPRRRTFNAANPVSLAWTPDGKILIGTRGRSALPSVQLMTIDPASDKTEIVPLAEAAEGAFHPGDKTLVFTRLPFQGSHTRQYQGGTAQNLWRFAPGADEATPLTASYPGTSKSPMWHGGRIYFASDRSGTMNLWSMKPDGTDLKPHTRHKEFEVLSPSIDPEAGLIAYQLGADLRVYEIAADRDRPVPITLETDVDQERQKWVEKPADWLTSAHISPDGKGVALTARGRVFVAPRGPGRIAEASRRADGVRHRDARFLPGGKSLLSLSDRSGEVELWTLPADGVGDPAQLTRDGEVLRWEAVPSPDGKFIAHRDKNQRLFLLDVASKKDTKIAESEVDDLGDLAWSPDGKWLAFSDALENGFHQIKLHGVDDGATLALTTDRYDSSNPAWSADGKFVYILSDRNLVSAVGSPWGTYQPEPYFDRPTQVFEIALAKGLRSPFAPPDELHPDDDKDKDKDKDKEKDKDKDKPSGEPDSGKKAEGDKAGERKKDDAKSTSPPRVTIDRDGLSSRLSRVPVDAGRYSGLSANAKGLFWLSHTPGKSQAELKAVKFARKEVEVKVVAGDVSGYELSADGKSLLIRKDKTLAIIDAEPAPADLAKKDVDLSGWSLALSPREEWRQMFDEAWRLERDYFYDRAMHGADWKAVRSKYRPLVDRVRSRDELSDLIAQMVAELEALHIFVFGGDHRAGPDDIPTASLGARLVRDEGKGGYRVDHIYKSDPDEPDLTSPLARPGVDVHPGDVLTRVDGIPALDAPDLHALLRRKVGRQVLIHVEPKSGAPRDVIARPISTEAEADLRYHEWELTRRERVEAQGGGQIGYVHLRAMGGRNFTEFARGFYPVFNRQALIIDVRHNQGGNIDSWIIGRLLRKPWFYWISRVGKPTTWNMQYAFRGHLVVLCDQFTASDGEAFSEGVKRLKLGTVMGTRTWGGEIWLSSSNVLVDRGIATAAETGVYGPEGTWLIEGHGVDPDKIVDNLPHATFLGKDAQLDAAISHLKSEIAAHPVGTPKPPAYPRKAVEDIRTEAGGR